MPLVAFERLDHPAGFDLASACRSGSNLATTWLVSIPS
jgi:hypothetical protein